jgi:hypothetical protein
MDENVEAYHRVEALWREVELDDIGEDEGRVGHELPGAFDLYWEKSTPITS